MVILVFSNNQPCLDISEMDVPEHSPNYGAKYGLNRDRYPDNGWAELRKTRIDGAVETELTPELRQILLEDLAFAYGYDTVRFTAKLKEFSFLQETVTEKLKEVISETANEFGNNPFEDGDDGIRVTEHTEKMLKLFNE